jgi:hypothetical protein
VRVSTIAQTLDQQNAALAAAGVKKTFSDMVDLVNHRPSGHDNRCADHAFGWATATTTVAVLALSPTVVVRTTA